MTIYLREYCLAFQALGNRIEKLDIVYSAPNFDWTKRKNETPTDLFNGMSE
jgi:hypothetical protein